MATNGSWKPGQSGNPGGRPKAHGRIRDLALKKCPAILKRLEEIASQDDDLRAAVAACMGIMAYGVGKPVQQVDLSARDGSLAEMFRAAVMSANGIITEAPEETGRSAATH